MRTTRYDPLNDFLFYKVMGEKGDEVQLLGFLNAVLGKTGDNRFSSVEIIENKTFTPEAIGDKSVIFDVRAVLQGKTRVNVEVQLRNRHNMDRRSLFYWSREYNLSLKKGQDFGELPNVVAINIVNYNFPAAGNYHSCFHLREDRERDLILTDALEIHFLNMVKYRKQKEKQTLDDPLYRWLVWLNKGSPLELLAEVLIMDEAIQRASEQLEELLDNEDVRRAYDRRFMALCDRTSELNYARDKGFEKGRKKGRKEERQRLLELLDQGLSPEEIKRRLK